MARRLKAPPIVEHVHTVETRWVLKRTWVREDRVPIVRYVCSCGKATKWYQNPDTALAESKTHAFDGQLSI